MSRCVFWHNLFGLLAILVTYMKFHVVSSFCLWNKLFTVKAKLKNLPELFMPSPLFCCHLSLCVKKRSVVCHSQITWGAELCFQLPMLLPGYQGPWGVAGLCSFPFSGSKVQDCGIHHIQLMQDSSAEGCRGKTALCSDCIGRVMIRSGQKSHCILQRVPPLVCEYLLEEEKRTMLLP